MSFEKHLVLNKYFLSLFGCEEFEELRRNVVNKEEGFDIDGRSNFLDGIINLEGSKIDELDLLRYDQAIKEYVERLRKNRRQPDFNLKYFQYLAVLFSEIFFDRFFHHRTEFMNELNEFVQKFNERENENLEPFSEEDFKKIAFSMATGGGKTLIMHINYWQFLKYSTERYDNIVLIPPNEGLSKQHFKEMKKSGIPCKLYDGNIDSIRTRPGEVLVIDIHKLIEEKMGEGVRVDVSYFEGKNLVFVDEGHKGRKSEDEVWKRRREEIARDGFIFEYSATFRQVVEGDKDLLKEYGKSILFEYSYKYFYTDGYGKDFYVYNLKENLYTDKYTNLILSATLLSFYEQVLICEKNGSKLREHKIEKPLLTFVGGTVTGKIIESDIPKIVLFFRMILRNNDILKKNVKKILSGESGLIDKNGNDVFKDKFKYLKKVGWILDDIYKKTFRGSGSLELWEIKRADGEIGLKVSTSERYFGVISVGDVSRLKKILEDKVEIKEDHFTDSLFFDIDKEGSPVNVLVGSRKFMEGWDSWRVSCMGLLNIGRGRGPQIIQLFGRGVRLKGKGFSLKREEAPDYIIRKLQTLFIFGLNADYINNFLEAIEREEVDYEERRIHIKFNRKKEWEDTLYMLKTREDFDFTENILRLTIVEEVLSKVRINLRPRITLAHGLEAGRVQTVTDEKQSILQYEDSMNWNRIYLEIMNYKISKGYYNLIIDKKVLKEIIKSEKYKLLATKEQVTASSFEEIGNIERVVLTILKSYIDKFYRAAERQKSMDYLEVETINEQDINFDFKEIVVKIPKELIKDFEDIFGKVEEVYKKDIKEIPTIHFDNHLYTPLAAYRKGREYIKTSPVKLNRGETRFVRDLRDYLTNNGDKIKNKRTFLLRNLSRKGIGFFQRAAGFYPDFILWIKDGNKQKMAFIDPKGLRNIGNFGDDKIQFCTNYINVIEKKVKEKVKEKKLKGELDLYAFIVSVSEYDSIKDTFGERGHTKEDFEEHNIVFQEGNYISKIIDNIIE